MKKKRIFIVGVILLLLAVIGWRGFRYWTNHTSGSHTFNWMDTTDLQSGPWRGEISANGKQCYLTEWAWDGDEENMEIIIPEEIEGITVVGLGGFDYGYADVFYVKMPEEYQISNENDEAWCTESDNIASEYPQDYPTYQFQVFLNSGITHTRDCESNLYISTSDGKGIAYKIEMIFPEMSNEMNASTEADK